MFRPLDVDGQLKIEEKQSIVYREAAGPQDASRQSTAEIAPVGAHNRRLALSTTLLFRYSALTFNGHRIHYDHSYATQVELYPGLVFHGPLQATILLNYAAEIKGKAPRHFDFRGMSPLFDHDKISMHANEVGDGKLELWTSRDGGPVGMSAEAMW